ncbi:ATP-binding protein [Amycolatopsis sp. CA-126428]|uniref:ATP-binding protein n=1 Tax=Amycolatopsis sp. CA-126428 TaxID=2073158 RepID=UPI0011B07220|nr:tetratricopeptide repeat protein [Amycolatopsis sp. CA-126428]
MPLSQERSEDADSSGVGNTHSEMAGSAHGVVQAREINGGVHFHRSRHVVSHRPGQLPAVDRHFVNRRAELGLLDDLHRDRKNRKAAAICTITGSAGVGKTSLAVFWSHRVGDDFPDGQLYVNLRGYDPGPPVSPETALAHFLRSFDVHPNTMPKDLSGRAALFRSLVAGKQFLILLDNALSSGQVRPLLPGVSNCLVLVTSRKRLPGLSVHEGARSVHVDVLPMAEATFLLRTVMAEHRDAGDLADLAELARLCAGLPLALRIAAERAVTRPWMSTADLIADLRDESRLWDALSTTDDDETDAVRAVFAWSYRGLTPEVARMFRLLGLHPGAEFSLPAAAALAGVNPGRARSLLDPLVATHLIDQMTADRYQFHDLLRAYALGQARRDEPAEQQREATRRMLSWYLHTADAAREIIAPGTHRMPIRLEPAPEGPETLRFAGYDQALDWYDTERGNLITATITAVRTGHDRIAWQLPATLAGIYDNHDPVETWLSTEETALEAARRAGDDYGAAVLLDRLGIKYRKQRKSARAVACFNAATETFRELSDLLGAARSTHNLGLTYLTEHRLAEAHRTLAGGMAFAEEAGSPTLTALILVSLGVTLYQLDDASGAEHHLVRALAVFRDAGDETLEARALMELCAVQREMAQADKAEVSIRRALTIARAQRSLLLESGCLVKLGELQIAQDAPEDALETVQRAAALARRSGNSFGEARAYDAAGLAYQTLRRHDDAVGFHREAVRIHSDRGESWELAITLDHLASALERTGRAEEAQEVRGEVGRLAASFTGAAAVALRARIDRHRASPTIGRSRGLDDA